MEGACASSPSSPRQRGSSGQGSKAALERQPGRTHMLDTGSTPSQHGQGQTPPWPATSKLLGSSGVGQPTPWGWRSWGVTEPCLAGGGWPCGLSMGWASSVLCDLQRELAPSPETLPGTSESCQPGPSLSPWGLNCPPGLALPSTGKSAAPWPPIPASRGPWGLQLPGTHTGPEGMKTDRS